VASVSGRVGGQYTVTDVGTGYELALSLPLARRAELGLVRLDDDLVITVAEQRRALALPSGLRRCQITGARWDGEALRVHFVPDPALWRP
jgi:arsenite-transporting ATPase